MSCEDISGSEDRCVGWTLESPGRGSLSLMFNCLATTALCTWIVIHPRIHKRKKLRVVHKLVLWLKTIIAPELIAVEAVQERNQARKFVKQASQFTKSQIDMVHAFYIGMFGVHYRTPRGSKVLWPNQLVWLLEQGLFDWMHHCEHGLSLETIKDKSNADATAKLFALVQIAWFAAQSIMRAAHHLPLAPLESMTLSYIPLFTLTYMYWWVKPKDVETPSEIELPVMDVDQLKTFESMAVDEKFDDEGRPEQDSLWAVFALTPRTFEKEAAMRDFHIAETRYTEKRTHFELHRDLCTATDCKHDNHVEPTPPMLRRQITALAHWDPELYHSRFLWPVACLFAISFPALHLLSWTTEYPTTVEMWLWRAAAIASIVSMLVFMQFEKITVSWRDPLLIIKLGCPTIYVLTRIMSLVLAFTAFRASDPALYETYNVSAYWINLL